MKIKIHLPIIAIATFLAFACSEKHTEQEIIQLESEKIYFEEIKMPQQVRFKNGKLLVSEHPRVSSDLPPIHVITADDMSYQFSQEKQASVLGRFLMLQILT